MVVILCLLFYSLNFYVWNIWNHLKIKVLSVVENITWMWLEHNDYCEKKQGSQTFSLKKSHWKMQENTENASIIVETEGLYVEWIVMKNSTVNISEKLVNMYLLCVYLLRVGIKY